MTLPPPDEWPHLAAKSDIESLRKATKSDLEVAFGGLRSDIIAAR
jgi:hypothetical protein